MSLVTARGLSLGEACAASKGLGVAALSLTMAHLSQDREAAMGEVRAGGLPVASVGTGGLALIDGPEVTMTALAPLVEAARDLGAPVAFTVSGPAPPLMPTDEAFERLVQCLAPAVAAAREQGVLLAVEHSSPVNRQLGFVHSLADAVDLSRETGSGVVVELQNCWYERDLPRLFRENAARFSLVQVSDFVVGEDLRMNRRVPGDGDIPLEWLIGELLDAGYAGLFEIELIGPAIAAEGARLAMARSVDWLAERLTRWGA